MLIIFVCYFPKFKRLNFPFPLTTKFNDAATKTGFKRRFMNFIHYGSVRFLMKENSSDNICLIGIPDNFTFIRLVWICSVEEK